MSEQIQDKAVGQAAEKVAEKVVGEVAPQPAAAPKPPKKLVPRTATPAAAKPATAKQAAAKPRRPSPVAETVERHRQVLAEALVEAQAINYEQPAPAAGKAKKPAKPAKAIKAAKVAKTVKEEGGGKAKKPKLVRDSYAMPEAEYARIGELKKRLAGLGVEIKKSELLRAGVMLLAGLADGELMAAAGRVERIKTGRPARK